MGVHSREHYLTIKQLLGIPEEEPIFILRGQDEAAEDTLDDYRINAQDAGASDEFVQGVNEEVEKFVRFKKDHSESMKVPD